MRRPYSVQVFLYRAALNVAREFLLFKRVARPDLDLPEFWQGISGALEYDESFDQAAIREVFEESGIRIDSVTASGFIHVYPIRPEWRVHYGPGPVAVEERAYFAEVAPNTTPQLSAEHQQWRWCSATEALASLWYGQNRAALSSVLDALAIP